MEDKFILGNRIRIFRKRAGFSQMELELGIESSPGSLSRIENGEVNPTKETLSKIADFLKLSNQECQYLYGNWFKPASIIEVNKAISDTTEYFNKKGVLAYILDERFRFIAISKSFQTLLGIPDKTVEYSFSKPFIKVILDDHLGIRKLISETAFEEIITNLLKSFHSDCGYMTDDPIIIDQINAIESDQITREIWKDIIDVEILRKHNNVETRKVIFNISGFDITMNFIRDPLYRNRRFEIIEYIPSHPFIKLISELII